MPGDYYEVNIHYLLNNNNIDSPLKLTFKHTDSTPGWKTFDVTPIVESWKQGWVNYGLKVSLTKGEQQLSCEGVYSSGEQEDKLNTEPLLVVFTSDNTNQLLSEALKDKKNSEKHRKVRDERGYRPIHGSCEVKELMVDYASLVIDDLEVILPEKLNVGACGGHCARLQPSSKFDYKNIVSLHYYHSKEDPPKRCCVPESYKILSVVFNNTKTKETIYKNANVRVASCTCL